MKNRITGFSLGIVLLTIFIALFCGCPDPVSSDTPDLLVDSISISPISPTTRDSITFMIRVRNIGTGAASASKLRVKVGGESMPPLYDIPAMTVGATYIQTRKMLLPIALTYLAIAAIDAEGSISELNETNNIDSLIFSVSPPPRPDLTVDTITISPISPTTRDSITFSTTIRNSGPGVSAPCSLSLKVGGESMPPRFLIPAMAAGATYIQTRKMLLPIALTYLAIATIDKGNIVIETDETNNIDSLIFRVNPPPRPDLTIDSLYKSPASPTTRDSITFSIRVRNNGPAVSTPCKLSLKVGGESMPPKYDIPAMAAGATYIKTRKMLLPIALTYLAIAHVDVDGVVRETNETNNLDSLIFSVSPPPRPDLTIDTLYKSPASPTTRDSITFSIRVRNNGPAVSTPCKLSLKVGGESMPPKYDIPAMAAGATYIRTRKMLLPIALTYLAIAHVDVDGAVIETNETNNLDSLIFSVSPPPRPDLTIDTLYKSPASPTTRDSITFSIRVRNNGPGISSACKLSLKVGGESMPPKYDIPAMAAGATYIRTRKMLLPIALTYLAIANIDVDGEVIETNETNNLDSLIFSVSPPPRPDLTIDTLYKSPASPTTRDSITFSVRVRNNGPAVSTPCKLSLKVGGESMPPKYDIPAMAAGATYIRTRKMLLPIALTYLAIANIDVDGVVRETNETNNLDSLIFSVSPPPRPDLTIDTLYKSPASPTTRDSITFSIRVRNNGPAVSTPCKLSLKVGGESMPPKYDIPAMAAGATYIRTRKMLLPIALTYLAIAHVDVDGVVRETNETNNLDSLIFSVSPPPRPDLTIDALTKTPASPTTRDSITFSIRVRNNGPAVSTPCKLSLKVGGESTPPKYDIPAIAVGATYTGTRKMLLPIALTYLAIAHVDVDGTVIETNETNNLDSLIFSVSPPPRPDLTIDALTKTPGSPTTDDSITFSIRVRNNGPAVSTPCKLSLKVGGESTPPKYDIPAIAVGATYTRTRKMLLPIALTYLAIANIDADGEVIETNEANNLDSLIFSVTPADRADLFVEFFYTTPAAPVTGSDFTISAVVINDDFGRSDPCDLTLKVPGDATPPAFSIRALNYGERDTVTRTLNYSFAQAYRAIAFVDTGNVVLESSERNNRDTLDFPVVDPIIHDLAIQSFTMSPLSPTTTDEITFTTVIRNNANLTSPECSLQVEIVGEATSPHYHVPPIAPGATHTIIRKETLTSVTNYRAITFVDLNNVIAETNEENNKDTLNFKVSAPLKPDLTIDTFKKSPDDPTTTDEITFTIIVKNNGPASAAACSLALKIGSDAVPDFAIPSLASSATHEVTYKKTITTAGKNIVAYTKIDVDEKVDESLENNNESSFEFDVSEAKLPDLIILEQSFYVNPSLPTTTEVTTLAFKVMNIGEGDAGPSEALLVIGQETSPPALTVPALAAGESVEITRDETIVIAGWHGVFIEANFNKKINESDETNNTLLPPPFEVVPGGE